MPLPTDARDFTPTERASVVNAIDLVRQAGWDAKAKSLSDALDEGKLQVATLDKTVNATTFPGHGRVYINSASSSPALQTKDAPPQPLPRNGPDLFNLAATLLHEADHLHFHGEIEAYGEQLSFYHELNENFDKYFPKATAAEKEVIETKKQTLEEGYARQRRDEIAK